MAFGYAYLPDLIVSTGAAAQSNTIILFDDAYGLSIQAPGTLTSTAITISVINSTSTSLAFATLQSGGQDIQLSAGKALVITPVPFRQLQLQGSAVEAATRTFTAAKVFPT